LSFKNEKGLSLDAAALCPLLAVILVLVVVLVLIAVLVVVLILVVILVLLIVLVLVIHFHYLQINCGVPQGYFAHNLRIYPLL
jgi:hypothetical protein